MYVIVFIRLVGIPKKSERSFCSGAAIAMKAVIDDDNM